MKKKKLFDTSYTMRSNVDVSKILRDVENITRSSDYDSLSDREKDLIRIISEMSHFCTAIKSDLTGIKSKIAHIVATY